MRYGIMNTYLNSQGYKKKLEEIRALNSLQNTGNNSEELDLNINEIDKNKQSLVHNVQNRRWLDAEEISEALINDMNFIDPET